MKSGLWRRVLALVFVTSFLITSCASFQDVQVPTADQSAAAAVQVGQTVETTTRDGTKTKFKVTAVEPDALVGEGVRVAYQDMTGLRVQTESAGANKTAWIVVGVLAVAAVAAAAGGGGGGSSY